jgi:hypothetical protein
LGQEFVGQMGSNETGTTSNQNVAEHGKMLRNSKVKKLESVANEQVREPL